MEIKDKALFREHLQDTNDKEYKDKNNKNIQQSIEEQDLDNICGIGQFKPQWLQKYATSKSYLMLYCIAGVIQGAYYTYLIGTLSTLEKRYAFKSTISGTIMIIDELTPLFLGVWVGYFGGRMHRPRVLAAGMYMSVLCCFLSALPYFLYGTSYQLKDSSVNNETETEFCDLAPKSENCDEDDRPPTMVAVVLLCVGSLCKGFASIAYYAIGLPYMDDSSKKKNSPIYFATAECMRLFGPILGFLMTSACLKFYENPYGDPGYGPEDPRWIGAWWLGFVIQGIILAIIAFPLMLFPRNLRKEDARMKSNVKGQNKGDDVRKNETIAKALMRLLKNPLFMMVMIGTTFSIMSRFGFFIMLPKYMEIQFRLSSSAASLFTGPLGLFAAQISGVLGGWVIYKWRPSAKQLIAGHAAIEIIWALGMFLLMIPSCHHFSMVNSGMNNDGLIIQNECNFDCSCSTRYFSPVCGPDGESNYFSPCYAGCQMEKDSNYTSLRKCSCLHSFANEPIETDAVAKRGLCADDKCWGQAVAYIIMFPVVSALANFLSVSQLMIMLRSIEPQDKSIAMGTFESVICVLGFLPNPVIYGSLADSACLIWESSCGKTGNCWYYDVDKFKYFIHGAAGGFGLLSTVIYSAIYPMAHRMQPLYEKDGDVCDVADCKNDDDGPIAKENHSYIQTSTIT